MYCRAEKACVWELRKLQHHYHPSVGLFASTVLKVQWPLIWTATPLDSRLPFIDNFILCLNTNILRTILCTLLQNMTVTQWFNKVLILQFDASGRAHQLPGRPAAGLHPHPLPRQIRLQKPQEENAKRRYVRPQLKIVKNFKIPLDQLLPSSRELYRTSASRSLHWTTPAPASPHIP